MDTLNIRKEEDDLETSSILRDDCIDSQSLIVCYAPKLPSTNPYQYQLEQSLKDLGILIHGIDPLKLFLPTAIRAYRPNIIHLHWLEPYLKAKTTSKSLIKVFIFIFGLIILKFNKTKIIWTVHNLKCHELYSNLILQLLDYICNWSVAKVSDSIIVHSEFAKKEVASRFRISHNKIIVIHHGNYIDYYENSVSRSDARRLLGIPDSDFCYLFLGHIRPYKGVIQLITVFNDLNLNNTSLIIAGSPLNDRIATDISKEVHGNTKIKLNLKDVKDDLIQVYINACDVIVLPYHHIFSSGAIILAMSFGKACILPNIGCINETINESGAFLYNPQEVKGLSNAMLTAFRNKSHISNMGLQNLSIATSWSWNYVAKTTLDVYE